MNKKAEKKIDHKNKMNPYFVRVKGSYKRFSDTPTQRFNETFLVKLGNEMDNVDAQNIVSSYIGRVTGFTSMDIYEVEIGEKEFQTPKNYFHVNNESKDLMTQASPKEIGKDLIIKQCKKLIKDHEKLMDLKGGK